MELAESCLGQITSDTITDGLSQGPEWQTL